MLLSFLLFCDFCQHVVFANKLSARVLFHQVHVVCDEYHCAARFADALQKFCYSFASLIVEIACWFIGQDEFGLVQDGACNDYALLFAA